MLQATDCPVPRYILLWQLNCRKLASEGRHQRSGEGEAHTAEIVHCNCMYLPINSMCLPTTLISLLLQNMIEYMKKLSRDDNDYYKAKLTLTDGTQLSDPFTLSTSWEDDISKLPNIAWPDVTEYLTTLFMCSV